MFIRPLLILCIAANSYAANHLLDDRLSDIHAVVALLQEDGPGQDEFCTKLMPGYVLAGFNTRPIPAQQIRFTKHIFALDDEPDSFNEEHGDDPNPSRLSVFARIMLNMKKDDFAISSRNTPRQAMVIGSDKDWARVATKEEYGVLDEHHFEKAPFSVNKDGELTSDCTDHESGKPLFFIIHPINTSREKTRKICNLDGQPVTRDRLPAPHFTYITPQKTFSQPLSNLFPRRRPALALAKPDEKKEKDDAIDDVEVDDLARDFAAIPLAPPIE
jgi:hypothetical protein